MAAFKLFFNDIGLLGAKSGLDSKTVVLGNNLFTDFKGALTEQFVMQQLKAAKSFKLFCEKFKPQTAIRTSLSNYRKKE